MASKYQLGLAAVVALVLLRLAIGWHFYQEGSKKFRDPSWSSAPFHEQAVGPLAPWYKANVIDPEGTDRLDAEKIEEHWTEYVRGATSVYHFDNDQQAAAAAALKRRVGELKEFFTASRNDLEEYWNERGNLRAKESDPGNDRRSALEGVPHQHARTAVYKAQVQAKMRGLLQGIAAIGAELEQDVRAIAVSNEKTADAARAIDHPVIPNPTRIASDDLVKWWVWGVGVLLVLGLFSRLASLAGAAFLLSVIMAQPPWVAGAQDTSYQIVELAGLLVLAGTAAGRFAGLDHFIHAATSWCCGQKRSKQT